MKGDYPRFRAAYEREDLAAHFNLLWDYREHYPADERTRRFHLALIRTLIGWRATTAQERHLEGDLYEPNGPYKASHHSTDCCDSNMWFDTSPEALFGVYR